MDLSNIDPSTIDMLLDEIDENERQYTMQKKLDSWIRSMWKIGSFVEVYSNASDSWFKGNIMNIITSNNTQSEIVEIEYMDSIQETHKKTALRGDMDEIRPYSIVMPIYQYIFNAINAADNTTPVISDLDDLDDLSVDELNDNDSNNCTPEPLDTPPPPPYGCHINTNYEDEEMKLGSVDEELPGLSPSFSSSQSWPNIKKKGYWQQKTMTRWKRSSSSIIKTITPITQKMAERKINSYYERRRSVATITHKVHKLFKLDPDLLKIREEYLLRSDENNYDALV